MYSVIVLTAVLAIYVFILVEESHNHDIGISLIFAELFKSRYRLFLGRLTEPNVVLTRSRKIQGKQFRSSSETIMGRA